MNFNKKHLNFAEAKRALRRDQALISYMPDGTEEVWLPAALNNPARMTQLRMYCRHYVVQILD
jgi:hypothetical protein